MKTDTVQLIPASAMMAGVILCGVWIVLYLTRIDAPLRRKLGERLGVRIVTSLGFAGRGSSWVAEGGGVGFGTSLLIFLCNLASILFVLWLPLITFFALGFFVATTLSSTKP